MTDTEALIERTVRAMVGRMTDRLPVPRFEQATVVSYDADAAKVTFALDEDPAPAVPLTAVTVTPWPYAAGMRIKVLLQPNGGALVLGPIEVSAGEHAQQVTSTSRPTTGLVAGKTLIYETNTGHTLRWWGPTVGWGAPVWNVGWGEVAYAEKTANQNGISAVTDITSLTLTWTALPSRKYVTHLYLPVLTQVTSAGVVVAVVTDAANVVKSQVNMTLAAGAFGHVNNHERWFSAAGSITRKARISTTAGTVDITAGAGFRAYLKVEDIGPNGAPS